ncbi:conserved hypothetical protein [Ricinus communis]|uniref:Uncharacterized protein n=1 Tax=Ricinus communis TaxID=3988 RepID=B9SQT2_RICCO|nr:conserved hypothetical protein [Ricinus communis]
MEYYALNLSLFSPSRTQLNSLFNPHHTTLYLTRNNISTEPSFQNTALLKTPQFQDLKLHEKCPGRGSSEPV